MCIVSYSMIDRYAEDRVEIERKRVLSKCYHSIDI
jgi:hypothetical protein